MHAGYTTSGRSEEECFHLPCAGLILSLLFSLSCVLYIGGSCKYSFYVSSFQAGIVKKEHIKIHGFWIAAACRSISICGLHYSRHAIVDSLWSESWTVAIIHVTYMQVHFLCQFGSSATYCVMWEGHYGLYQSLYPYLNP